MKRSILLVTLALFILLAVVIIIAPHWHNWYAAISWKIEGYRTYLRNVADPAGQMPTALPPPRKLHKRLPPEIFDSATQVETGTAVSNETGLSATPSIMPSSTAVPTPTLLPLPGQASVPAAMYEKQDANNCGPATLTMYLRFFGWEGNQYDITKIIKPNSDDRNVNVDELIYFVRTHAGWVDADYRVGGTLDILKRFIAYGIPIMIEESSHLSDSYWPGDDHWAGHYLLLTAYNDANRTFTSQDSWVGPDLPVAYDTLNQNWQAFNRAYIFLYRSEDIDSIKSILGSNWDEAASRTNALNTAKSETQADPGNAFAWFNMGTNLLYFNRNAEAAAAYDSARKIGLPQRMLRYQFGPFIAYFKTNRNADLLALTEFALKITPNSEENLLWHGWALYRQGDRTLALKDFEKALENNPEYQEAQYATDYVTNN
jgi:hypothetical protein